MEVDVAVPEDDFETAEKWCAGFGVPFIEVGLHRSRGGERHGFSAEPGGQDEGADDRHRVEGGHPQLCSRVALSEAVAGGEVGDPFVETGEHQGGEAKSDLPAQLGV